MISVTHLLNRVRNALNDLTKVLRRCDHAEDVCSSTERSEGHDDKRGGECVVVGYVPPYLIGLALPSL